MSIKIIGAGTGNIDSLTLAAFKAIRGADVIIIDKLVSHLSILSRKSALVKIADKKDPVKGQNEINSLMLQSLSQGMSVVRLKGGCVGIYSRLAEEIHILKKNGYLPRIIPGISSISTLSAELGVPITSRGIADSFTVITASRADKKDMVIPSYNSKTTLIILMGASKFQIILDKLLKAGYPQDTSVGIGQNLTLSNQVLMKETIQSFIDKKITFTPPLTIMIGKVVDS